MGLFFRASRNILFKAIAEIFSRAIYLLFFLYLARKLGDRAFGIFSFAFSFAGIFAVLVDPGLNLLLTRDIAANKAQAQEYTGTISALKLVFAAITLALSTVSIVVLEHDRETVIVVVSMSILAICNAFMEFQSALFNAFERMEYDAILKITNKILVSLLGSLALYFGCNVRGVTNVMMAATGLSALFGFYLIQAKFFSVRLTLRWSASRKLLWNAFPVALMMIFTVVYYKIDIVLMSQVGLPQEEIGWYAASSRLIEMLNVIPGLVVGGLFPILSTLISAEKEKLRDIASKIHQILLISIVPVIVTFTWRANDVISFFYGSDYASSASTLRILVWATLFFFPNFLFMNLFFILNFQRLNAIFAAGAVVFNIMLNLIILPRYGFLGAGIARVLSEVALFLCYAFSAVKYLPQMPLARLALKPVASGVLMAAIFAGFAKQQFHVVLPLGMLAYVAAVLFLKTFSAGDYATARQYMKNLILREGKS